MKKILLALTLLTTACTSKTPDVVKAPVCAVQESLTETMALVITTALSCEDTEAVKKDIQKAIGATKLCEPTASGPIGAIACPIAVNAVTSLIQNKAPTAWKCKVDDTSKLSKMLNDVCVKVIPFKK